MSPRALERLRIRAKPGLVLQGALDTLRIIKGNRETHILIDERNLEKFSKAFKDRIIDIAKNLCEVSLELPQEAVNTPGVFSLITNAISLKGINILDCYCTGPEYDIYIHEKDQQDAYNVLQNSIKRAKERTEPKVKKVVEAS